MDSVKNTLVLYFAGTKMQEFMGGVVGFAFSLLFYRMTGLAVVAGVLSVLTVLGSRVLEFFLIPLYKGTSPIRVSAWMSLWLGIVAVLGGAGEIVFHERLVFYVVLAVLFSGIQELGRTFVISVLPRIIPQDRLFKVNSMSGMISNALGLLGPFCSYFALEISLSAVFVLFGAVSFASFLLLRVLEKKHADAWKADADAKPKGKTKSFSGEWFQTLRLIVSRRDILFCVAVGTAINIIFVGLMGPFLLKAGDGGLNSAVMRGALGVGSFLGIFGAFVLKVKERYEFYLKVAVLGALGSMAFMMIAPHVVILAIGMALMFMFVMFMMNTTGTFLQIATPPEELTAVYAVRATFFALAGPLSSLVIGVLVDAFNYRISLAFGMLLLALAWTLNLKTKEKSAAYESAL